jgi:NADP-dependent 3-hydroxy acid dehydrogenase YdfG
MAEERVLLITGASAGIGAATARAAAADGWRVVLAARSEDKLKALVAEIGEDRALAVRCDVKELDQQQAVVERALDAFGRLDAVFANAGYGAKRGFLEGDADELREMVLTNVMGVAWSIRTTLPHFLAQDAGHYLITSSIAGRRALPGSLYSASKHAVTAMGESLRLELRQMHDNFAVRVTVIEPGMVDTAFFDNPVANALEPEDIARAAMYALSQPPHVDVNEILIRPVHQAT